MILYNNDDSVKYYILVLVQPIAYIHFDNWNAVAWQKLYCNYNFIPVHAMLQSSVYIFQAKLSLTPTAVRESLIYHKQVAAWWFLDAEERGILWKWIWFQTNVSQAESDLYADI